MYSNKMLNTIDYGLIPIAKHETYLQKNVIGLIEETNGEYYEIRLTNNGQIVAIKQ